MADYIHCKILQTWCKGRSFGLTPRVLGQSRLRGLTWLARALFVLGRDPEFIDGIHEEIRDHKRCVSDRFFSDEDPAFGSVAPALDVVSNDGSATIFGRWLPGQLHRFAVHITDLRGRWYTRNH